MTYQDAADTAHVATDVAPTGSGHLVPVVGGGILALLWGAYTLMIVYSIATSPLL